jgi:SAM-dependent methyltransferase
VTVAADLNPQEAQMADESMVRTLAAQAAALWPQEAPLLDRYRLPEAPRILDAGCGTGEIASRLALRWPRAEVLGVDVQEGSLRLARERHADLAPRLRFEPRSVYDLGLPDASFDLTVCRHVIQSIPHPEQVLAELVRVTRPGGRLHLLAEDYGMIFFQPGRLDPGAFWRDGPLQVGAATGTDMQVGRKAYSMLHALGLRDLTVDYLVADPLRVPRQILADIWTAWRDGYADFIAAHSRFSREEAVAHFDDMIATLRDPAGYGAWLVPVLAGTRPEIPGG